MATTKFIPSLSPWKIGLVCVCVVCNEYTCSQCQVDANIDTFSYCRLFVGEIAFPQACALAWNAPGADPWSFETGGCRWDRWCQKGGTVWRWNVRTCYIEADIVNVWIRWTKKKTFNVTNASKEPDKCDKTDRRPNTKNNCRRDKKTIGKVEKLKSQWNRQLTYWVMKLVCDVGFESLETTMNDAMNRGMPSSWRYNEISPIYKGKDSVMECGNYRGIKLMSHTMKIWERII